MRNLFPVIPHYWIWKTKYYTAYRSWFESSCAKGYDSFGSLACGFPHLECIYINTNVKFCKVKKLSINTQLYVKGICGLLNFIPNFFSNLSIAKSPPPNKRMQSAPPMYKIRSSSKYMLNPAVTIAWYIATPIVPTIESDARRVNSPAINNQLP